MTTKLRLTRHGSNKRPFYWLVAADSRAPRDGSYIEKLGTYNPLLDKENSERINFKQDRVLHWLSQGALPTDRVIKLCRLANIALPVSITKKHDSIIAKKIAAHQAKLAEKKKEEAKTAPSADAQE